MASRPATEHQPSRQRHGPQQAGCLPADRPAVFAEPPRADELHPSSHNVEQPSIGRPAARFSNKGSRMRGGSFWLPSIAIWSRRWRILGFWYLPSAPGHGAEVGPRRGDERGRQFPDHKASMRRKGRISHGFGDSSCPARGPYRPAPSACRSTSSASFARRARPPPPAAPLRPQRRPRTLAQISSSTH